MIDRPVKKITLLFLFAMFFVTESIALSQGANTWPNGATAGKFIHLNTSQVPSFVPEIYLPDGCRLSIRRDPSTTPTPNQVTVSAGKLTFGKGAIIDLAAFPNPPPAGADGINNANAPQPGYGQKGASGTPGKPGLPGQSGLSLTINVGSITPSGSLWILTSGEPGSKGGNGGSGGLGGGMNKSFLNHCNGGDGGDAGAGGSGGDGGATSQVRINVSSIGMQIGSATFRAAPIAGDMVAPPDGFGGDNGNIFIYGAPGKGGDAGKSGTPGAGGDQGQGHTINPGGTYIHGGNPGRVVGPPPQAGKDGARTP